MSDEPTISVEDEAELLAASADLAGAVAGPWQPACIARAFATPLPCTRHLTMQQWIDLDALRSPFLRGEMPADVDAFLAAAEAMHLNVSEHTSPEDIADLHSVILRACAKAFATALPMRRPGATGSHDAAGFGDWLPLYACLVAEIGLDPDRALELRVDRALALIAGLRHNQGCEVAGTPYALRELPSENAEEDAS